MPLAWLAALLARHSASHSFTVFFSPAAGAAILGDAFSLAAGVFSLAVVAAGAAFGFSALVSALHLST
jgi:hypothetical protein